MRRLNFHGSIQSPFKNPPDLTHTKIQEAKLVERLSDLRRGLQRREVGIVQAFPHLSISVTKSH